MAPFLMCVVLTVGLFEAALYFLLFLFDRWPRLALLIRQLFLIRYSLLILVVLLGFGPLSWLGVPSMLANLFVVNRTGLACVTFMSLVAATTVVLTAKVILANAPERFPDYAQLVKHPKTQPRIYLGRWQWGPFIAIGVGGLMLPILALILTNVDRYQPTLKQFGRDVLAIVVGAAAAYVWLIGNTIVQRMFLPARAIKSDLMPGDVLFRSWNSHTVPCMAGLTGWLADRLSWLKQGFVAPSHLRAGHWEFRPGHLQLLIWAIMGFGGHYLIYVFGQMEWFRALFWGKVPALSLLLLLVTLVAFALTFISFFLDAYRVSPLIVVAVISALVFWINDIDHYFQIRADATLASADCIHTIAAVGVIAIVATTLGWAWSRSAVVRCGAIVLISIIAIERTFNFFQWTVQPPSTLPPRGIVVRPPLLEKVASNWDLPLVHKQFDTFCKPQESRHQRVLVIVTAAGGGIQAAGWTNQVLSKLSERYGPEFSRSIRLISCVSGGSLGTAQFLAQWDAGPAATDPLPPSRGSKSVEMACEPSIDAVAWGFAFPDLLRMTVPPLVAKNIDRGWALEETWKSRFMQGDVKRDWRISDLVEPVRQGLMPIVAFNAVHAETGRRVVISPVALEDILLDAPREIEFGQLFPPSEADLPISTAVRLSATFPYVSPIARPAHRTQYDDYLNRQTLMHELATLARQIDEQQLKLAGQPDEALLRHRDDVIRRLQKLDLRAGHYVDGGYSDNEGTQTAVTWARRLLSSKATRGKFDKILIIRIMPFEPAGLNVRTALDTAANRPGWSDEWFGPALAMMNVRSTSQTERNSESLFQLKSSVDAKDKEITYVQFTFRRDHDPVTDEGAEAGGGPVGAAVTPLSWKMSRLQKDAIKQSWAVIEKLKPDPENNPLTIIDNNFFDRQLPP